MNGWPNKLPESLTPDLDLAAEDCFGHGHSSDPNSPGFDECIELLSREDDRFMRLGQVRDP